MAEWHSNNNNNIKTLLHSSLFISFGMMDETHDKYIYILSFHFISKAWHCIKWICLLRQKVGMRTHSRFFSAFSFFPGIQREDQSHHLGCQSCWSKPLAPSLFSTAFLIRLFIRDQTQAPESIGNSREMTPFFWLFGLLSLLPLVLGARSRGLVLRVHQPDGRVLHRSKRDWMWRQFFLSEEYTGSNYQYVGKVSEKVLLERPPS